MNCEGTHWSFHEGGRRLWLNGQCAFHKCGTNGRSTSGLQCRIESAAVGGVCNQSVALLFCHFHIFDVLNQRSVFDGLLYQLLAWWTLVICFLKRWWYSFDRLSVHRGPLQEGRGYFGRTDRTSKSPPSSQAIRSLLVILPQKRSLKLWKFSTINHFYSYLRTEPSHGTSQRRYIRSTKYQRFPCTFRSPEVYLELSTIESSLR